MFEFSQILGFNKEKIKRMSAHEVHPNTIAYQHGVSKHGIFKKNKFLGLKGQKPLDWKPLLPPLRIFFVRLIEH